MKFKQLHEKATSIAQQKLMALALQHKRGELDADKVTPAVEKLAKSMSEKELDDFASTKHKGLPQKKEDNEISNRSAALKPQMYNDPVTGKKKVPKHVKMAIGVASDPRYKQGNYSGAVRSIEKIKKGLSKHPQVAAVLKKQNEALDAKDTDTVKDVLKALKGASKAHAKQAKQLKKDLQDSKDPGEYDNEGEMAKTQLKSILRDAEHMIKMFDDEENLPEWVQNKITKAQDYLQSAHSYMMGQDSEVKESVNEVGFQGKQRMQLRRPGIALTL
jgi:HPt (histidine-containing phosphotransfer) domain-containing protein